MVDIQGMCDPKFAEVREEFARNFSERGDVGASVSVVVEGETVVDLWGGIADPATGVPWREDTITVVMSMTKGATALCAHILADRGELDIDAPVAHYWPEFGANGKETIPVRMLLNHQAGLPGFRFEIPRGKPYDWDYMTSALAAQRPFWQPGLLYGYHALTFGWLVGEVVRRVSGKSVGTFFRDEVAVPLGLDFWIGLPESEERRAVPLIPRRQEEEDSAPDPRAQGGYRERRCQRRTRLVEHPRGTSSRASGQRWPDQRARGRADVRRALAGWNARRRPAGRPRHGRPHGTHTIAAGDGRVRWHRCALLARLHEGAGSQRSAGDHLRSQRCGWLDWIGRSDASVSRSPTS